MFNKRVRCPHCASLRTKKKGKQSNRQHYGCSECGQRFQLERRQIKVLAEIWNAYTQKKQTLQELAKTYGRSHVWVRKQLDRTEAPAADIKAQQTVIIVDTTFWGRLYGVLVFRSWTLRKNIWWGEVTTEKVAHYHYARKILEECGWSFTAAVIDGRRGLATVFKDIPVQICHFHQMKTVTKYLTRRPETDAGKALRSIMLTLPHTTEPLFTEALMQWEKLYRSFITEKTLVTGTKHWYYTHKNVRSAYRSLATNLPHLFTYQKYPELNIPNTTNTIDGYFAGVKKKVAAHHGLRKDRRFKVISELLKGS